MQITCHLVILLVLAGTARLLWLLLEKQRRPDALSPVVVSILITLLMNLGPLIFTWVVRFEDYASPRTTLYVSLGRTFLLEIVVLGVLLFFWLNNHDQVCQTETTINLTL